MSLGIKHDDMVMVIAGKDKGAVGRVLAVLPKKDAAIVEHVNMVKRHQKPRSETDRGGIIEKEAPIALCKLMLADPGSIRGEQPRAARFATKVDEKGRKSRVLKLRGESKEITV